LTDQTQTYGYEPSITDASKPKLQIYQKYSATTCYLSRSMQMQQRNFLNTVTLLCTILRATPANISWKATLYSAFITKTNRVPRVTHRFVRKT